MRPVELELAAFGPYPDTEVVDFRPLAALGLFVVAGPTGAGKSTLFDAMTFALFGTVPGERLEHIRSHHADPRVRTTAALTFDTPAGRFRVERDAKHERPRLRGTGHTTEPPAARLFRIVGDRREPLVSGTQAVKVECERLVGLSAAQFQRVVLLPQGKWAEFLLADTASRRDLLQQLFGTELYERATQLSRERAQQLRAAVEIAEHDVGRHRTNAGVAARELAGLLTLDGPAEPADAEALLEWLVAAQPMVDGVRLDAERRGTAAATAHDAHGEAVAVAQRWDQHRGLTQRFAALDTQRAAVAADVERVELGRRAAPVAAAQRTVAAATTRRRDAVAALDAGRRRLGAALEAAGIPVEHGASTSPITQLAAVRSRLSEQLIRCDERSAKGAICAELATAERTAAEANDQVDARLTAIRGARRGELARERHERLAVADTIDRCSAAVEAAATLLTLRREVDELGVQVDVARVADRDADATLSTLTDLYLRDTAPELASHLVVGCPCPVCGSTEHPAPATPRPATTITRDDLTAARHRRDTASANLHALIERLDQHRHRLGRHADDTVDELVAAHDQALGHKRRAAAAEHDLLRLDIETNRLDKQLAELDEQRPLLVRRHATLVAELAVERGLLEALEATLGPDDPVTLGNRLDLVARAERAAGRVDHLEREAARARAAADQAETQLAAVCATQGFPGPTVALEWVLPTERLAALARDTAAWTADVDDVSSRLAQLTEAGRPDSRPDVDALAADMHSARPTGRRRHARLLQRVELRAADASLGAGEAVRLERELAPRRAEHEAAQRVFEVCNGNNTARVQLETWVLAGELDRVTSAANAHLARMTRHRYQLRRDETGATGRRGGLDLVVDDADTGRPRPPTTLSGGEQFQASLALALGLADVMSQTDQVHEALFIDEGFGSLDADALDEAVDALVDLHSTGRMVGVITHVEAMKRQLPVGIEVTRRRGGGSALS